MTFLFQSLLGIGLPLLGIPLLIHLINLRRRRRVEWAAMDFLLASQKRSKRSVLFRQILLWFVRTLVLGVLVLMLAGPILQSTWGELLGTGSTHHLILLDDSYSMSDQQLSQTANPSGSLGLNANSVFDRARQLVANIVDQAGQGRSRNEISLLRFSQAASLSAGTEPTISRLTIDSNTQEIIEQTLTGVAESNAGPLEALQAVDRLPEPTLDEARIVYLISDFRRPQWTEGTQLPQQLRQLSTQVADLRLVQCAEQTHTNLALTKLQPSTGIRAAGVETWFEVAVHNYGDVPATAVTLEVEQDGLALPAITMNEIPAGKEISRKFRVTLAGAGAHTLEVALPSDAVPTDNRRYFACQLPSSFPVLIIDGSEQGDDGYYLQTALSPGGTRAGGWSPQIHPPSYLQRHEELQQYVAICLLDVPRLNDAEVAALEEYVQQGGGLAFFLGPQVNQRFYNEHLHRSGEGIFPVALDVPTQLLDDAGEQATSDIRVTDNPLLSMFADERNSFLSIATVDYYYALAPEWKLPTNGATEILAQLSNGAPWIVTQSLGAGRVLVQLSKLSPKSSPQGSWSNWCLNPVFPVYANELMGYLSAAQRQGNVRTVGDGLGLVVSATDYQREVQLHRISSARDSRSNRSPTQLLDAADAASRTLYLSPLHGENPTPLIDQTSNSESVPAPTGEAAKLPADAAAEPHSLTLQPEFLIRSGLWQVDLLRTNGNPEKRLFAMNVPLGEGELQRIDRTEISQRLSGIDYHFSFASDIVPTENQGFGYRLSDAFLCALLFLLVGEQLLSYWASYHYRPDLRPNYSSA